MARIDATKSGALADDRPDDITAVTQSDHLEDRDGAGFLRAPGADGHVWLARSVLSMGWGHVMRPGAGQRVKQEMAGPEVGRGGPDAPARDELNCGGRGGPAVDVQSHPQGRA